MNKTIEAPQIAKEKGMTRLVFEDDFDSMDTIDLYGTGKEGYKWYVERVYKAPPLEPDDYSVENSILKLHEKNSMYNFGLVSVHPKTQVGFSFFKGVLEFRFRIPRPRKNDKEAGESGEPAVWSFPPDKLNDKTKDWVEPDWLEYWGDGFWTTTVHHSKREDPSGPVDYWISNYNHAGPKGLDDEAWHTMTCLWDDGLIESYVDGELCVRVTYAPKELNQEILWLHAGESMGDEYHPLERDPQTLILSGAACNPLEIDWIRVWQRP